MTPLSQLSQSEELPSRSKSQGKISWQDWSYNAALLITFMLWGVSLGYPLQHLQNIRWVIFGNYIPVYYFLTVLPVIFAAGLVILAKRSWTRWEIAWVLLPVICLPGILLSSDPVWSTRQWFSWIVRGVIPGGVIFLVHDRQQLQKALVFVIYPIIVAAALLGLAEIHYNHNPFWEKYFIDIPKTAQPSNPFYRPAKSLMGSDRPQGTQGNRIPYCSTIVAFLPLGFWLLKYKKRFYALSFAGVSILLSILILAQARSGWVGMVMAIVLMPVLGLQTKARDFLKILAGVVLCWGLFLALPRTRSMLWERIQSFERTDRSIQARSDVLQTVKVLKHRWFTGVGYGQFPVAAKPYYHGDIPWFETPDNQYVRWVIENGIPSLALLLAFLTGLVYAGWKKLSYLREPEQRDFYKSLLVGWLSLAVTFLFFDGFYWGACNFTFWALLGAFATCLWPALE